MCNEIKEELVSIIVPIYNVEPFLEKCVNSLLNQTYTNIEVILVDDGSPDECPDICDKYREEDHRVKVIHKKNGGLSSARNSGLKVCRGDYIMFVDSDDWIEVDLIEKMVKVMRNNPVQLVTCGRCVTDENYQEKIISGKSEILSVKEVIKKSIFNNEIGIAAWGKLYKRIILENIEFPEGEIHEDVAIIYHIFNKCSLIYVLDYAGYYYRYNADGISKQQYSKKYDVVLKHVLENEQLINTQYPELKRYTATMVSQSCVDMLIKIIKTEQGYVNFIKQYNDYRYNLKIRKTKYIISIISNPKMIIWLFIFLLGNRKMVKLYKKIGIYK